MWDLERFNEEILDLDLEEMLFIPNSLSFRNCHGAWHLHASNNNKEKRTTFIEYFLYSKYYVVLVCIMSLNLYNNL